MTAPFHLPAPTAAELETMWLDWLTLRQDARNAPSDATLAMLAQDAFTGFLGALYVAERPVQQELLALVGPA